VVIACFLGLKLGAVVGVAAAAAGAGNGLHAGNGHLCCWARKWKQAEEEGCPVVVGQHPLCSSTCSANPLLLELKLGLTTW